MRLKLQKPHATSLTSAQRYSFRLTAPHYRSGGRAFLWVTNDDKGRGMGVDIDRWEAARIAAVIQHFADTGEVES